MEEQAASADSLAPTTVLQTVSALGSFEVLSCIVSVEIAGETLVAAGIRKDDAISM